MTLAALALLACTSQPAWLACEDPACRQSGVVQAFAADPHGVVERLGELDDVEQATHVRELVRAYPTSAEMLCDQLPAGPGRAQCMRDIARPHLQMGHGARMPDLRPRKGPGPSERHPPPPAPGPAPWLKATPADLAASLGECAGSACDERAARHAAEGEDRAATLACAAAHPGEELARQECLFKAAEAAAVAGRGLEPTAALCALAGNFATGCMHHALALTAPEAAPADDLGRDAAEAAVEGAKAVHEALGGGPLGGHHAAQFWAMWTAVAYEEAEAPTAGPVAALPGEVVPHLRVAAAWRLVRDRDPTELVALDPLVAELTALLHAETAPLPEVSGRRVPVPARKYPDFWAEDLDDREGEIPAAYCLGPGRRPFAAEEELDLQLAALEAAARLPTAPPEALWLDAAAPERHEWVRWTATRIAAQLHPELELPADDSPLVRARRPRPGEAPPVRH